MVSVVVWPSWPVKQVSLTITEGRRICGGEPHNHQKAVSAHTNKAVQTSVVMMPVGSWKLEASSGVEMRAGCERGRMAGGGTEGAGGHRAPRTPCRGETGCAACRASAAENQLQGVSCRESAAGHQLQGISCAAVFLLAPHLPLADAVAGAPRPPPALRSHCAAARGREGGRWP